MSSSESGQSGAAIEALGAETRTFPPPSAFRAQALTSDRSLYEEADADRLAFWARQARELLTWRTDFDTVLEWELPHAKWFVGGTLNVSENCLDRHVQAGGSRGQLVHLEEVLDQLRLHLCVALDHRDRLRGIAVVNPSATTLPPCFSSHCTVASNAAASPETSNADPGSTSAPSAGSTIHTWASTSAASNPKDSAARATPVALDTPRTVTSIHDEWPVHHP